MTRWRLIARLITYWRLSLECHCRHTATPWHCRLLTLPHTATHCNTLQHTAALIGDLCRRLIADSLQHTAAHCNTLQHTATHCNTLQHTASLIGDSCRRLIADSLQHAAAHCNTLQYTAAHCRETRETDCRLTSKWHDS